MTVYFSTYVNYWASRTQLLTNRSSVRNHSTPHLSTFWHLRFDWHELRCFGSWRGSGRIEAFKKMPLSVRSQLLARLQSRYPFPDFNKTKTIRFLYCKETYITIIKLTLIDKSFLANPETTTNGYRPKVARKMVVLFKGSLRSVIGRLLNLSSVKILGYSTSTQSHRNYESVVATPALGKKQNWRELFAYTIHNPLKESKFPRRVPFWTGR